MRTLKIVTAIVATWTMLLGGAVAAAADPLPEPELPTQSDTAPDAEDEARGEGGEDGDEEDGDEELFGEPIVEELHSDPSSPSSRSAASAQPEAVESYDLVPQSAHWPDPGSPPYNPFDLAAPELLYDVRAFADAESGYAAETDGNRLRVIDIATGDVDGNGTADIVSFAIAEQQTSIATPGSMWLIAQRTDGFGGVETGTAYLVGWNPYSGAATLADVDGDGDLDIVVTLSSSAVITQSYLNDGTGRFMQVVTSAGDDIGMASGVGPRATEVAASPGGTPDSTVIARDLDGDGHVDLLAASRYSDGVMILTGNGDGSFTASAMLPHARATNIAILPLSGPDDVVVVSTSALTNPSPVRFWREDDDGWTQLSTDMPTVTASAAWVGDFDGDGDADLVLAHVPSPGSLAASATVLRNDSGTLTTVRTLDWPARYAESFADEVHPPRIDGTTHDLDGDGRADIVVPGQFGEVSVLYGEAALTFADWRAFAASPAWEPYGGWDAPANHLYDARDFTAKHVTTAVAVADITGDGRLDLVTGVAATDPDTAAGRLALIPATGGRTFRSPQAVSAGDHEWSADGTRHDTLTLDWDGDSRTDILRLAPGGQLLLQRAAEGGGFAPSEPAASLDAACVHDDMRFTVHGGAGDWTVTCLTPTNELITQVGGVRTYGAAVTDDDDARPLAFSASDYDQDGHTDLLYVIARDGDSRPWLGWARGGAAGFAPGAWLGPLGAVQESGAIGAVAVIADLTGDGVPDAAVAQSVTDGAQVTQKLLLAIGSDAAAPASRTDTLWTDTVSPAQPNAPADLTALDLDGDGLLDLVAHRYEPGSDPGDRGIRDASVLLNDAGTFARTQHLRSSRAAGASALADLNDDGDADLITPTDDRWVEVRYGRGDGTFGGARLFPAPAHGVPWVAAIDIDDDGRYDVVGRSSTSGADRPSLILFDVRGGGLVDEDDDGTPQPTGSPNLLVSVLETGVTGELGDPARATVTLEIANTGDAAAPAGRTDALWLSSDDTWDVTDALLATLVHTEQLAPGASILREVPVDLIPQQNGSHYVIARADARKEIAESDENDNDASAEVSFAIPLLAPGAPRELPASELGSVLRIAATDVPLRVHVTDAAQTRIRIGAVPTVHSAQQRLVGTGTLALLPGEERFVHVLAPEGARIELVEMPFGPGSITPSKTGNGGTTTFTIDGIGLNRATGFTLIGPGGEQRPASDLRLGADGKLQGTVDLAGAAVGSWSVAVTDGVHAVDLPGSVQVVEAGEPGKVTTSLQAPERTSRVTLVGNVMLTYWNGTLSDAELPLIRVLSRGVRSLDPDFVFGDFHLMTPQRTIAPSSGAHVLIPFTLDGDAVDGFEGTDYPVRLEYQFVMETLEADSIAPYDAASDFAALLAGLDPARRDGAAAALAASFGDTIGGYVRGINRIIADSALLGSPLKTLDEARRIAFEQAAARAVPGVTGTLATAAGEPLGLRLLTVEDEHGLRTEVRTDAAGIWHAGGLSGAVTVWVAGFGPGPVSKAGASDVVIPDWTLVTGRVRDDAGVGVRNAAVTLIGEEESVQVFADENGFYRLDGIRPGTYTLSADSDGSFQTQSIVVGSDTVYADLDLPAAVTVTGTISNADGPVAATVTITAGAHSVSAVSDAGGEFTLTGAMLGTATVEVWHPAHPAVTFEHEFTPGANDLGEIVLAELFTLRGTVTVGGSPVAGAEVGLAGSAGGSEGDEPVVTDELGRYELPGVAGGDAELRIETPLTTPFTQLITVTGDDTVDIDLATSAIVQIAVTGSDGTPRAGIEVVVRHDPGTDTERAFITESDAEGTATVIVPVGDVDVESGDAVISATVVAGFNDLALTLRDARIFGTVADEDVSIWAVTAGGTSHTTSDEEGAFEVFGTPGEAVVLRIVDPILGVMSRHLTFPDAGDDLDLGALVAGGHRVTVSLPWMNDPDAEMPVMFFHPADHDDAYMYVFGLQSEGSSLDTIVIPQVEDGDWVVVLDDGVSSRSLPVTVAGSDVTVTMETIQSTGPQPRRALAPGLFAPSGSYAGSVGDAATFTPTSVNTRFAPFATGGDGVSIPSKSALTQNLFDLFRTPEVKPISTQIDHILRYPYPPKPSECFEPIDITWLIISKARASKAAETHEMMVEQSKEITKQLWLGAGEAAARGVMLLNDVLSIVSGVGKLAKAIKKVSNETRAAKKLASQEINLLDPHLRANSVQDALDSIDEHQKRMEDVKTIVDASGAALTEIVAAVRGGQTGTVSAVVQKLVSTVGPMAMGLVQSLAEAAGSTLANNKFLRIGNELLGPASAISSIIENLQGAAESFKTAVKLLDNLREGAKGLERSYDFEILQMQEAWDRWLNTDKSPKAKDPAPEGCEPPPPPPSPPTTIRGPIHGMRIAPADPNEITGPLGVGDERWMQANSTLGYRIDFENLGEGSTVIPPGMELASGPAAEVIVTLPLPAWVDLDRVRFTEFGFGTSGVLFTPDDDAQSFYEERDFAVTVPDPYTGEPVTLDLLLRAEVVLDRDVREAVWRISLIDPETGLMHSDALAGFLPPEPLDDPGAGRGFTGILLGAASDVPTGAVGSLQASIVFDVNEAIETNTWSNTFDRTPPGPVGFDGDAETEIGGSVSLLGNDEGAGIGTYDVWRQINDSEWELWMLQTTDEELTLTGDHGTRITLAARATDQVYNAGGIPEVATFSTVLVDPNFDGGGDDGGGDDGGGDEDDGGTTPGPGADPDPPIAVGESELNDATRGGVRTPEAAARGSQIRVYVDGAAPGDKVHLWLHSEPLLLGSVTLNAARSALVTIPYEAELGPHRVVAQREDGSLIGWDDLRVVPAEEVGPNGEWLAASGADPNSSGTALFAVLLVLLGAALAVSVRRRRDSLAKG